MKTALLLFILSMNVFAQVLGDPIATTQRTFNAKSVETRNLILSDTQMDQLEKSAQQKIDSKLFRVYLAKNDAKTVGYGVLINKRVRTKTAVALYLIDPGLSIRSIEIVAFNEPIEYLPTKTWLSVFDDKTAQNTLRLNQDIPTVTGATLSARTIADGSRIALSLIPIARP